MYKSSIGTFIANILMVWLVLLNNEGPGWEVPYSTMETIGKVSFAIFLCFSLAILMLLVSIKQLKVRSLRFKLSYFLHLLVSIAFLVFLFVVRGFKGQYWFADFPNRTFTILSVGIVLLLFALVSIARLREHTRNA